VQGVLSCETRLKLSSEADDRKPLAGGVGRGAQPPAPLPAGRGGRPRPGRAVQVDPIKPNLKLPGTERLKLTCDELLSTFAFKFKLRRYKLVERNMKPLRTGTLPMPLRYAQVAGRGRHTPHSFQPRLLGFLQLSSGMHNSSCTGRTFQSLIANTQTSFA
jgi:hypothetical protein